MGYPEGTATSTGGFVTLCVLCYVCVLPELPTKPLPDILRHIDRLTNASGKNQVQTADHIYRSVKFCSAWPKPGTPHTLQVCRNALPILLTPSEPWLASIESTNNPTCLHVYSIVHLDLNRVTKVQTFSKITGPPSPEMGTKN